MKWPKQAHLKPLRNRVRIYDQVIANHREERYQTKELARATLDRWVLERADIKAQIGELVRPVNAPPRYTEHYARESWKQGTQSPGARCLYHVARIQAGWRPGKRIRSLGYDCAAEWYGVKIWEYIEIIGPLVWAKQKEDLAKTSP